MDLVHERYTILERTSVYFMEDFERCNMNTLSVELRHDKARLPARHSRGAAGYDLCSVESVIVPPGGFALIDTGVAVKVPPGTYGRVAPRSGMSVRGTSVGAGVIDADYRGTIRVLLFNHSTSHELSICEGDRIAQLVLEEIRAAAEVVQVDALDATERGSGGFGSTGL